MAAERLLRVGWGTGVTINAGSLNFQVLATTGDVSLTRTSVYHSNADVGDYDDQDSRVKTVVADGVLLRNGNIAFDCDNETLPGIIDWVIGSRKQQFSVLVGTQELEYVQLDRCHWTQFTLNGSAQGLVNGSFQFVSNAEALLNLSAVECATFQSLTNRSLVPYWQTGNNDVSSWTLSIQQTVSPIYCNTTTEFPRYFRVGHWEININVETLVRYHDPNSVGASNVRLCLDRLFSVINGFRLTEGVARGGIGDVAKYTYSQVLHGSPDDYNDDAVKQTPFGVS